MGVRATASNRTPARFGRAMIQRPRVFLSAFRTTQDTTGVGSATLSRPPPRSRNHPVAASRSSDASSTRPQHPEGRRTRQVAEHRDPVVDVVDDRRQHNHVDRVVSDPVERLSQVVDAEVGVGARPVRARGRSSLGLIEADHVSVTPQQLVGVQARPAVGVQHCEASDVTEK